MSKEYMTINEVAEYLGVCGLTMRKWVARGYVPHVQITPTCIRIRREDLDKALKERTIVGQEGTYLERLVEGIQ